MNRPLGFVLLATMTILSANCQDIVFHKSKITGEGAKKRKKQRSVDLIFASGERTIRVVQRDKKKSVIVQIPFDALEKVSYGYSKHHRIRDGFQTIQESCPAGG